MTEQQSTKPKFHRGILDESKKPPRTPYWYRAPALQRPVAGVQLFKDQRLVHASFRKGGRVEVHGRTGTVTDAYETGRGGSVYIRLDGQRRETAYHPSVVKLVGT